MQPRAHQKKNGTCPFLFHGLGTKKKKKKKGGGEWSPYLYHLVGRVFFNLTAEPGWDH